MGNEINRVEFKATITLSMSRKFTDKEMGKVILGLEQTINSTDLNISGVETYCVPRLHIHTGTMETK